MEYERRMKRVKKILQHAIADEKGAQKMYGSLSKSLKSKKHKKTVAKIRKQEHTHKKMLEIIKKEL